MVTAQKIVTEIVKVGLVVGLIALFMGHNHAIAAGAVDDAYVKSLASAGKTVLVIEYYDGNRQVALRKGYTSAAGFKAASSTDITINASTRLHLFGLEPCAGDMVNQREDFSGKCEDFAREQLAVLLKSPRVLFCRAFVSEENAASQDVTCFGYYNFPGTLDTVDNLEEQLLSIGALRLAKKADGSPMRPDLVRAEKIGRSGYGMWADPRVQAQ